MTTRRTVLGLAAAAGVSVLGGCAGRRDDPASAYRLILTTPDGAAVLDETGRVVTSATTVATATADWRQAVVVRPEGAGTRVTIEDLASDRVLSTHTLRDRLEPRVVSPAGDLVASVPPGGAPYGLHRPGGRERTTLVVSGRDGERRRVDLPGTVEPYAFSPDGGALFVLDFTPAAAPRRFAVRAVDLATGRLEPVAVRAGSDALRAHRLDDVHDPRRDLLFTLYALQEETTAFVHCVHLRQRWTRRIDLPAPFGRERPGVHAIAMAPAGDRLCVFHSPSARLAEIDPDRLTVTRVDALAPTGLEGKPNVAFTTSGRLLVHVDTAVMATGPARSMRTPGPARGLVVLGETDVWAGHPTGVVRYDLATGAEVGRLSVPDLYILKRVTTAA
jgi:hypothetical protein